MTDHDPVNNLLLQWSAWSATPFQKRAAVLIEGMTGEALQIMKPLISHWQLMLGERCLPGPVGESNTLRHEGRGPFLCLLGASSKTAQWVQVGALLLAGNAVLVAGEGVTNFDRWLQMGVPVMQCSPGVSWQELLAIPALAGVALLGQENQVGPLQRAIAERDGAILPLLWESDSVGFGAITRPSYWLELVTERTVCINTAAVGGDAGLLTRGVHNAPHPQCGAQTGPN